MTPDAESPFDELLRSQGAVFGAAGGVASVPLHYGRPEEEYRALTCGVALIVRTWASRLVLTGADRERFLNGMITCDVRSLEDGQSAYGFLTTANGRILSDATVMAAGERLDLELPWDRATVVAEHLGRYIVADRVEIAAPSDSRRIDLVGPEAAAFVAGRSGFASPESDSPATGEAGIRQVDFGGVTLAFAEAGRFGAPGFSAWVGADDVAALLGTGTGEQEPPLPPLAGHLAWDTVRVEAGVPRFGQDFDSESLPQETGIDEAVSYTKGCYLGQEIVARIHYRGQVPRGPRSLRLEGDERPPYGAEVRTDGREVGLLTSVVRSPAKGFVLGLAVLHRRAWEPGSRVEIVGAGEAEVLPVEAGSSADDGAD